MSKKKSTICILLLAIVTIAFLPWLIFQKEKQIFTEPNEMLAVFLETEKSKTFPAKNGGYVYDHTECTNDEIATWDADTWKLTISKIKKETKCNVYFTLGFTEQEFAYKGSAEEFIVPVSGNYKLEVWGAQGGEGYTIEGGKGGYASGTVFLEANTVIYVNVGGQGTGYTTMSTSAGINPGGFNGGGESYQKTTGPRGSGGGATDIRIKENTLYHRVIVAGGGGGSGAWKNNSSQIDYYQGGAGGGTVGKTGTVGKPGTQTAGGTGSNLYMDAGFGYGGYRPESNTQNTISAGGGGWYGGGAGNSAAGGSGWIYTEEAFNVWQMGNPTDAAIWKLETKYYLENASTIAGDQSIPTHDGLSTMTGNSGNGYAKLTLVR